MAVHELTPNTQNKINSDRLVPAIASVVTTAVVEGVGSDDASHTAPTAPTAPPAPPPLPVLVASAPTDPAVALTATASDDDDMRTLSLCVFVSESVTPPVRQGKSRSLQETQKRSQCEINTH